MYVVLTFPFISLQASDKPLKLLMLLLARLSVEMPLYCRMAPFVLSDQFLSPVQTTKNMTFRSFCSLVTKPIPISETCSDNGKRGKVLAITFDHFSRCQLTGIVH